MSSADPERSHVAETRSQRERQHFDSAAAELGSVWWGSVTPAGRLRLKDRGDIAIRRAHLRPGLNVLEPGAGNGEFTTQIAGSGATITGIEISPRQQQLAAYALAQFPNVRIAVGDVEEPLDFPNGHFDCIVGNSVLHHLDLTKAMPEFYRVLKPRGRFFFFEPNMLNPQIALEKNVPFLGRRLMNSPDETAFFRWRLGVFLRHHGFVRVDVRPFDFLHPGTPSRLAGSIHRLSSILSSIPIVREIAGSLQVYAERPA